MPSYLLWYSPPSNWQKSLDSLKSNRIRRRKRLRFTFDKRLVGDIMACPQGFEVQLLDKDLLEKADNFKLDLGSRFWKSEKDFLKNGLGTCLVKDDEVICICYAACVVNSLAEIDIVTKDEYRGRGLATVTAQHFIQECIRRGIEPTWDCFLNNTASMKLAEKLGFTQAYNYLFYSFNFPIEFDSAK